MLGFQTFRSARTMLQGIELMHMTETQSSRLVRRPSILLPCGLITFDTQLSIKKLAR